jgi:hypothetical protein
MPQWPFVTNPLRRAYPVVGPILCAGLLTGCESHTPAQVDRAAYQYWVKQHGDHHITSVSCDQHGSSILVGGTKYTAFVCAFHGGHQDGATVASYWNGHTMTGNCIDLPDVALNALCFD